MIADKLLEKAKEAFVLAVEIYNKPTIKYRVEGFTFFICNAWELMLKAYLIKTKGEESIYYKDNPERTINLENCIKLIFTNDKDPLRLNLEKIIELRNTSTHFITEEYEMGYVPLFQSCLFNFSEKMQKFHEVDVTELISLNFLNLVVKEKSLDENEIKENLNRLCEKAKKRNIKLLMENERKTYAESPVDCFNLMQEEKNINIIFDLSNAFLEGYNVFEEYEKSKNRITYIHLRDFDNKTNKYAHLGQGDIGIEKFMEIIKRDNFDGVISIETHLPMNESGETKQELFLKSINLFYSILEKLKIKI